MPSCLLAYVDQSSLIKISPRDVPRAQLKGSKTLSLKLQISLIMCAQPWRSECFCSCRETCVKICTQVRQAERGLVKVAPVVTDKLPLAIQGFAHRYQLSLSDSLLITGGEKY